MPGEYIKDLVDHKRRVAHYLQLVAMELFRRATVHDNSKFSPEEFEAYEAAFPNLQKYAYGSPEFKAELAKIEPAIKHHYQVNDHHPEFFKHGINEMDLIQIIEMVCDWIATSERSKTDVNTGLQINARRFTIGMQLEQIIKNTLGELILQPTTDTLYPEQLISGTDPEQGKI